MKVIEPVGESVVDVNKNWAIRWEVVDTDPKLARFWLTHLHTEPKRDPVPITGAVDIHEAHHVEVQGTYFQNMPSGGGYRIWAMDPEADPNLVPSPIAESQDIAIRNEQ